MSKPHVQAELIKAWADGAEIEYFDEDCLEWRATTPHWHPDVKYRIKPTPKPDEVVYGVAWMGLESRTFGVRNVGCTQSDVDNLKLTFDGETGKLKAAEVLK